MKIAICGGGTLDMEGRLRDGSIGDRRELIHGLEQLGHEVLYIGPKKHTPDDLHVVNWEWRGEVDALVVETRFSFFPPLSPEGWDEYLQGLVYQDWALGKFGDAKLFTIDFDAQTRRVLGLSGRSTSFKNCNTKLRTMDVDPNVYPLLDYDMFLEKVREEVTLLLPYTPSESLLEKKRKPGHNYKCVRWLWPYPTELEVDPLPWDQREISMFYPGSDYNRREKFWKFYVEGAKKGAKVEVSGVWNNHRLGDEPLPWREKGWRDKVLEGGEGNLTFMNGSRSGAYLDVHRRMRMAKCVVQILANIGERLYADLGYYTVRPAETAAAGVIPFIDADIKHHEDIVLDPFFQVRSFDEVMTKMQELKGKELDTVQDWRAHLRAIGTGVERGQQLVDMINS